ncbi:DeoR/GlpR family DNA-binding transcription regulator [Lachnospiraceae bacterium 47-T17]
MLAAERRNEILSILKEEGRVIVADLSKKYDVTEETIRRDLEKLENDGYAERTYGGAVLRGSEKDEVPFLMRKRENVEAKMRIATALSQMINDGDRIMLDASTTALFVAKQIRDKKNITVITNSIEILLELSDMPDWKVLSTGGSLKGRALSLLGYQAERMVDGFFVDKAILSCKGVDLQKGFTDSNELDAGIKKQMLGSATKRIMAVDNAKFDHLSFTQVVDFSGIDLLATDKKLSDEWEARLMQSDVEILYTDEQR